MFYCQKCAEKNAWPESFVTSYGPCEICHKKALCNDVPSKYLPIPRRSDAGSTPALEVLYLHS